MAAPTLVIGNKNYSSWSLRPWLALRKSGIAFEEEVVWLDTADTRARLLSFSGSARVPVLMVDGWAIWDTMAICEWAAEQVPTLWPADAMTRARARSVTAEMHSSFEALRAALPMNIRAEDRRLTIGPDVQADIDRVLEIWRDCRGRHAADGPWLFGPFSIADAFYAPVISRFYSYGVKLDPIATAYRDTLFADPDFAEWREAAHSEAAVIAHEEIGEP
ncbi:MAG: glutathione S-transferase family protein [Alphaproteobacteria bacterium]|nr:glutathione S-transferase family protein [Alphaproteobacteria bacterium]